MGNYHVNKVEMTTLGSHDSAVNIFQNFLPISRSLSKCEISNTLTAIYIGVIYFFKNKRIVNDIPPTLYWKKGNVDMPNRAPVLDSGPRIYVAVKSQDEETMSNEGGR